MTDLSSPGIAMIQVFSFTMNVACVALLLKNEHRFTKLETTIDMLMNRLERRSSHRVAEE